jgi:hypothetical protein
VESTYSREERINFVVDRTIGVLGGMVDAGGLSPREAREAREARKAREAREVTQAAKVALGA